MLPPSAAHCCSVQLCVLDATMGSIVRLCATRCVVYSRAAPWCIVQLRATRRCTVQLCAAPCSSVAIPFSAYCVLLLEVRQNSHCLDCETSGTRDKASVLGGAAHSLISVTLAFMSFAHFGDFLRKSKIGHHHGNINSAGLETETGQKFRRNYKEET